MKRKIYKNLLDWKKDKYRKPLILQGARQIGKTYIVNDFAGKEYHNYVYCNFEKERGLESLFDNLVPGDILRRLSSYKRKEIIPGKTLIVFDEIQSCPQAITSLKYFCEDANEYHIIALGSLLGLSVNRGETSFPVGKVQFLNMYPMDFEEYLLACGEEYLVNRIKERYSTNSPLESVFHERAIDYYKDYLYVGGLPEAVESFVKNKNPEMVRIIQNDILESYQNDMSKYNKQSEITKTAIVYKSISTQLAKENRKFQYRSIKTGGRASEFENAIEWLCLSGIASQLYRLDQIALPLNSYRSLSDFKFFMNDVGLCNASQNIHYEDIYEENPLMNNFKGGLTENYVFNQLAANGLDSYYWTSGNQAEIDFVTRIGHDIVPIEVKSSTNTRSRSLSIYKDKYNPEYSIRLSLKNFGFDNQIKSIPLYAAFCIK